VTACLSRVCNQFIKMPTDQAELHTIVQGFYDIANFPNIVGAIDGTHDRIKFPSTDEHLYVNLKNYPFSCAIQQSSSTCVYATESRLKNTKASFHNTSCSHMCPVIMLLVAIQG
jgi:hypothetical protein